MEPTQHSIQVGSAQICAFEWGQPGVQSVFLVHATGFHARCWDQVVAQLPTDWHVVAVDVRGHGRSDKLGPYLWQQFADDLLPVIEHFALRGAIGVGHSMGGHCVTNLAADHAEIFSRLVLVDPVMFPPGLYEENLAVEDVAVADHPVARRRSRFTDWEDMHARYKERRPYSLWRPDVFADYCRYGVEADPQGGVRLACPGEVEAQVYINNFKTNIYDRLADIQQPVVVLRAPPGNLDSPEIDFAASPTYPELAAMFPAGKDVYLPELTHFIPMQAPELVAQYIRDPAL